MEDFFGSFREGAIAVVSTASVPIAAANGAFPTGSPRISRIGRIRLTKYGIGSKIGVEAGVENGETANRKDVKNGKADKIDHWKTGKSEKRKNGKTGKNAVLRRDSSTRESM